MPRYDFEAIIDDRTHRPYNNIQADSESEARKIAREKVERDYPNAVKIELKKR